MSDLTVGSKQQVWLTQRPVAIGALMATAFLRPRYARCFDTVTGLKHTVRPYGSGSRRTTTGYSSVSTYHLSPFTYSLRVLVFL